MTHKHTIFFLSLVFIAGFGFREEVQASTISGYPVLAPDGTVYQIADGVKKSYRTPEVFFTHGYKFSDVQTASLAQLALPMDQDVGYAEGTLVKGADPTVFVITNGKKRPFTSAQVFSVLGYSFQNVVQDRANLLPGYQRVIAISSATISHPVGSLINVDGAVFLVTLSGRRGIASLDTFNSFRFDFKNVLPANIEDRKLTNEGLLLSSSTPAAPSSPVSPPSDKEEIVSQNKAPSTPVITGFLATFPATNVGYKFSSTDPEGQKLSYILNWGDGTLETTGILDSGSTLSDSHTWYYSGEYVITFTVKDSEGTVASNTKNVKVNTDTSLFGPAVTVLSPNGGESYGKRQPVTISWVRNWMPSQAFGRVDIYFGRAGINQLIKQAAEGESYGWDLGSMVAADNYRIVVISQGSASGGNLSDQSDADFSITD